MQKLYFSKINKIFTARKKYVAIALFFLCSPLLVFSTHVVGGSLTYVYNGGSNYTITLKLYRDCGPGTAALPGSVTIQILGNDGQPFTPSKNVTINLTSVTNIAPVFDPCAIPPNPAPCVEEAIYTTTVNNLPPNPGGYHMYFQICCRNGSIINITNPGAAGETFYANIPGMTVSSLWNENFTLPNNTTTDNGTTSWNSAINGAAPSSFGVSGNIFQVAGANNAGMIWTSQVVNIASCASTNLSVDLSETGTMDANDSILVYYRLNGGPLIPFPVNGFRADDFTSAVATATGLVGSTIQIVIRTRFDGNSPNSEIYSFDNINISCVANNFIPNSDPVFKFFPPLFICVNQPFTFNHSATDLNGDSLVYSLYQPYNNTAPTFTNNTASFPPITYVGGYNALNPLGAGPFSINPSTGLLSGTPGTLGQFVVGVKVKEYRNGVYIGETIRDFQFNVVNCPQPPPTLAVPNATINNGCTAKPVATGITSVSATWTSISPGAPGAYNNYLACTSGCLNNTVTPIGTPPAFVDFVVCGISTSCSGAAICDTFRITFNPTLGVTILPSNPTLCFGQTSTTITAVGSGGTAPYTYLWNNVNPSQTINVGAGTYNVQLSDASGCPPVFSAVVVTAFSVAITANAGLNQTKCIQSPLATLNGSVTGASGGIWSGGTGTFSPNNTTLSNLTYSPTAAELASGSVNLILTTTGNGTCPLKKDTVKISYLPFTGVVTPSITNVSCYGGSNGTANINLSGGIGPYTYLWNTVPTKTTSSISNLPIGTYSVTVQDGIGCSFQTSVTINQPPILATSSSTANVKCFGTSTGSIALTASGGTTPYTYSWSPGGQTSSSLTALSSGSYTGVVTDANGCINTSTYTITQPLPITYTLTPTNVSCFNGNNGAVTTTVSGGTSPYTFQWLPGGSTSQNATGLTAGNYTLTITDNFNCTATTSVAITQPTLLVATTNITNETCNYLNNGSISVTPTGGTPSYTYSWQPGGQTTASITNQASGTYTVTVTDNKGCPVTAVAVITEPTPLVVNFINQINVSCFGGSNGSVSSSVSGGTANYTYSWSPGGATSSSINNIPIGTYTVIVNDNNSCLATNTITITQPTDIITTSTITNVSCNGGNNGTISLTPSGGISPYTYFWSAGGATTSSVSNLTAGNYSVAVTDANGCIKNYTYTVTQPLPITIAFTPTNVSCFGGSNGAISSTISGGTPSYSFSWSPNTSSSQNVSGLIAGTYSLTITDSFSCTASNTITITEPTPLVANVTSVNETCNYLNNGSASATQSGGTPSYTYSWQPGGQTTASITNQASGTYTVIITDSKGCPATAIATITEPTPLAVSFVNQINVSCFGGNNASIGATPSGGTPNYTYSWTPGGASTNALFNISAGTYTVSIKDINNCLVQNTVAISQPTAPLIVSLSSSSTTCNGGTNGSVTSIASGGTPTYSYNMMPGAFTSSIVPNLSSGTYSVTATDLNGCVTTNTVFVNQPAPILPVTTSTNSTCGNNNGIGAVSVTGGIAPYTYSWMPAGGTNSVTTGIAADVYSVTVTDANNCSVVELIDVDDSGGPNASIFSIVNVSCNGGNDGAATASIIGGLAPITYTWFPTGGNGTTASGLTAGTYYIMAEDANGCVSSAITSPSIIEPPPITETILTSNVTCFAGTNGFATVTALGGTPGYTYTWLPSSTTGSVVSNLSAGNYSVQIKDSHNCIHTATYAITQPTAALSIAVTSTSVSCFGGNNGSTNSIASGGTNPYMYKWMPGNISGQSISNLSAGTYTSIVTDIQNCTATATIIVTQPTAIVLTSGSINSNCGAANGQASVSATGGTGTYTYSWMPTGGTNNTATGLLSGTYSVTVRDANNCNAITSQSVGNNPGPIITVASTTSVSCFGGSNATATASVTGGTGPFTYTWSPTGGNGQTATGLSAGIYTVNITATNGCLASAISPSITQPSQIFSNILTTNVSCFGGSNGSATVTAGGGNPSYTYTWLPGATTGSVVSGLSIGTYSVQVKDINNCIHTATYSISQPTAALAASATSTAVSCFGGSNGIASASATGGTAPYSYNWIPMNVNGSAIGNLSLGVYTVNVTDFKNCTTSTTVSVSQPTLALSATASGVPTSCSGGSDGTATVTPIGGTAGYTYSWSPSGGNGQTANSLNPGTYIVTVNDAKNCQTNVSVIVSSPTPVTGSLNIINAACGLANGSISSQISGGTGPYTYTWSPIAASSSTIGGLLPNTYTLSAADFYGCIKTLTTTLINVPSPSLTLISTLNDSCFGGNEGSATINITQGTLPYSINWLPYGGNSTTASQLTAGVYTANVVDARGCLSSITANITEPSPVSINLSNITNVSCFGGNNGSITVLASGGTPGYNYTWLPSGTGASIGSLSSGTYTVNVRDSHFCSAAISMAITQPSTALTSSISNVVNLLCHNSTGSASSSVSGGTIPYTYTWTTTPPQNTSTATNILTGTYTVNISDANGCTTSNTVTLTQPSDIISNSGINDTICLGQQGTLVASAIGGAGNYYYVWQPVNITNSGTLTVGPTSNSNYTVVAFDQNGCAGLPDTTKIIVFNLAPSNVQTFGLSPICAGQSSLISALASGNTGPITYNWSNGLGTGPGPFIVSPSQPTTYYVDILNSCGVSIQDSVVIQFNPPPTVLASFAGTLACVPGSLNFLDNSVTGNINDPITSWLWDFGDGTTETGQNPSHNYNSAGTYSITLTVTTDAGCTNNNSSAPIVVNAYPYPTASFTVNSYVFNLPYDVLNCTNLSSGAVSYNWSFGDGSSSTMFSPSHTYNSVGNFEIILIATSQYGCSDTAEVKITTDADVVFPNAFTPNSDGPSGGYYIPGNLDNDIFFPYTSGVIEYKFQIFNRWGELIFETEDIKQGWDGYYRDKICQVGVYVWKAYVKLNNGKEFNKTGDVTLLR